ncbi:type VII secretion protein EssA [Neobacillus vireti]|uniref:type VII secretion protein EssA n=1 Tax=Neobacillus vireti TaxID=220686 RepID=UPI002FFE6C9D
MKKLVNPFSFFIVCLGMFSFVSLHPLAETTLDHSGKLRLETDRISKEAAEREKPESQDNKETVLEKVAPDLFKEQTRAAIQTKQTEMEKSIKKVKQKLFIKPSGSDTSLRDKEKALFASDYSFQSAEASHKNHKESFMSSKMVVVLIGMVAAGCAGIYVMSRKIL